MTDAATTLGEVGKWGSGGTPKSTMSSYYDGDIPWIRSGDLPDGPVLAHPISITQEGLDNSSAKWVPEGAVLIALYGATIGTLGITTYPVTTNQAIAYCIPNREITSAEYLFWYLLSERPELVAIAQGGAQPNISQTILKSRSLVLPPPREQCRIVGKLQNLNRRSTNARAELARIPRLVERYKEAVLSAAFRGDLTAAWREKQAYLEQGVDLLAGMLDGHAKITRHKVPRNAADLDLREVEHLPPIPNSWTWIPVEFLASKVTDGVHKKPSYVDAGVPFLTVRNLTAGPGISFSECRYVTEADHSEFIERTHPECGDILISKDGTLGVVRAVRTKAVFSIFVSLALVKPIDRTMTDYLELAFSAPQVQQQMVGVGTGLQHIHLNDLRRDLIPVAPAGEREEIVLRVRKLFGAIDRMYAESTRATELLDRLDQSTLAKAFRGELVTQAASTQT